MSAKAGWNDQKMERFIGSLLRVGVSLSAAVVFLGAVVYLVRYGDLLVNYGTFAGEPDAFRTVRGVFRQASGLNGRGIIQLGLLLLIATPIARVGFSIIGFVRERDRLYAVLASVVLVILLYSLVLA